MDFKYNSHEYKKPFGAVSNSENINIIFPISKHIPAQNVRIILRQHQGIEETFSVPFGFLRSEDNYNLWECNFTVEKTGLYFYRFEVDCPDGIWFIGKDDNNCAIRGNFLPEWQLTVYNSKYVSPKEYEGGIIYQVFVDRFNKKGDLPFNKKGVLKNWNEDVTIVDSDGVFRANDFYGGNIQGIIEKLDYFKSLNVDLLYLSPIFESWSNHRYDTADYMKIDDLLGSEKDFEELISKAKEKGIGVILDGVFNHTGADSIYFNKFNTYENLGAYQSRESKYYDWFTFKNFPDEYECWWGITVVPTINKNNPDYKKYLLDKVIDKWTKKGIAGWRFDVIDELPEDLVNDIHKKIKEINSKALMIGEVWEDASNKEAYGSLRPYFTKPQIDGVMNYPFKEAILSLLKDNDLYKFKKDVEQIIENYPRQSLNNCMTLLDSHDTARIINVLSGVSLNSKEERLNYRLNDYEYNEAKRKLFIAVTLQFLLPGMPTIYYGDEIGMQGFEDPINRRPFAWGKEDKEILNFYREISKIRSKYKSVMNGSTKIEIENGNLKVIRYNEKYKIIAIINAFSKNKVFTNDIKNGNLIEVPIGIFESYGIKIFSKEDI